MELFNTTLQDRHNSYQKLIECQPCFVASAGVVISMKRDVRVICVSRHYGSMLILCEIRECNVIPTVGKNSVKLKVKKKCKRDCPQWLGRQYLLSLATLHGCILRD